MGCFECWNVSFSLAPLSGYPFFLYFQSRGSFRFPDGPASWSGWPVDCPADGQCPWARDGHFLMLGIVAGTLLEEGDGSIPRLVSQFKWEGDTVYKASLALCPWTIMTEFQRALREGQGQARPKWPPS